MKEGIDLKYIGGIVFNYIFVLLLLIIITYLTKLENIGCECSTHPNKEFIKAYTIISLIYLSVSPFISMKSVKDSLGETAAVLLSLLTLIFYLIFVIYIYMTFDYVRFLINEKCKCSEGISRDVIMIGTMIELFLLIVALFTGIIIPVLTESISSIITKIDTFKNDVKESINTPTKSLMKSTGKIKKSAKTISSFLKKSSKDLKKLTKSK